MNHKIMINAEMLKTMPTCSPGYEVFKSAHGDADVSILSAFESNGWDDIWWFIDNAWSDLPEHFRRDIRILGCDYAERVLPLFEKVLPDDKRPHEAIRVARLWLSGESTDAAMDAAAAAAMDATWEAATAAATARAAARAAATARAAARAAAAGWDGDVARDVARAAAAAAGWDGDVATAAGWAAAAAAAMDATWAAERKFQETELAALLGRWS